MLNLRKVLNQSRSRKELQATLELKDRKNFRTQYLDPALEAGWIALKYPDSPNHPKQAYLLTEAGKEVLDRD